MVNIIAIMMIVFNINKKLFKLSKVLYFILLFFKYFYWSIHVFFGILL